MVNMELEFDDYMDMINDNEPEAVVHELIDLRDELLAATRKSLSTEVSLDIAVMLRNMYHDIALKLYMGQPLDEDELHIIESDKLQKEQEQS